MSRVAIVAALFGIALLIFSAAPLSATPPTPESDVLTIRIDEDGTHWWNVRRVTPENLPKPILHSDPLADGTEFGTNFKAIHDLLYDLKTKNGNLVLLMVVHENAHFVHLDNLLMTKHQVEHALDSMKSRELNVTVDTLSWKERSRFWYQINFWEERDNRIISAARTAIGQDPGRGKTVNLEHRFVTRYENGYWDVIRDKFFPRTVTLSHRSEKYSSWTRHEEQVISHLQPLIPPRMGFPIGFQGAVRLEVVTSGEGIVQDVRIIESTGDLGLENASLASAHRCRFERWGTESERIGITISYIYPPARYAP